MRKLLDTKVWRICTAFLAGILDTSTGQFCAAFLVEALSFFVVVANTRAYTHGLYMWTFVTDVFFSAQGFAVAKVMTEDARTRTWWAGFGFTLGGATGSLLSIFVTKKLYGE